MWFKNLQVYAFDKEKEFNFDPTALEVFLDKQPFHPCSKIMPYSAGWIAPVGNNDDSPLAHHVNGLTLISLQVEQKIMPASVICEKLTARITELEKKQGRKISSKEKLAIKDDIYSTMVLSAFSKTNRINSFIDEQSGLLIIDAPSRNKAEDFCSFLRKTLGSLPIMSPVRVAPQIILTKWLKQPEYLPGFLVIGDKCALSSVDESGSLRCNRIDIVSEKIHKFLTEGAEVNQLQLHYKDNFYFNLKDDFSITGIKFSDVIHDLAQKAYTENAQQEQDSTFVIMSSTIKEFLNELLPFFTEGRIK